MVSTQKRDGQNLLVARGLTQNTYHPSLPFCDFAIRVSSKALKSRHLRKNGFCENPVGLGEHLRNRRIVLGLTQEQVAAQLGIMREVYERWERNERQPVVSVWPSIIAFLGYYPGQVDTNISDLVLRVRRITGLYQKALAMKVGVIHQSLRDWEHNRRKPNRRQLRRLKEIAATVSKVTDPAIRPKKCVR